MREFDRIIRSKVEHFESPVPTDAWNNIYKALPKKEKRPYPLYFLLALTFVLIAVGGSLVVKKLPSKDNVQDQSKSLVVASNQVYDINGGSSYETKEISDAANRNSHLSDINDNAYSNYNSTSERLSISSNEHTTSSNDEITQSNVNNLSKHQIKFDNTLANKESNTSPKPNNQLDFASSSVKSNINRDIDESTSDKADLNALSEMTTSNNDYSMAITTQRQKIDQLTQITLPSTGRVFGTDQSTIFEMIHLSMKKNASMPCPTFVKKQNISFFEIYFSNDYGIRTLQSKSTETNAYQTRRENTEFPYFSYSVGTRFGIGWESGIAFKTGLDYTQLNEKFIYVDPNSIQKKTITILKYIYDGNFNVIDSVKTTEEIEIPGTNTVVNYNKLTFFDLPILFQYTIPGRKRLSYSITTGPFINLSFSQSGKILSQDNKTLIDLGDNTLYKNNIGLSMYAALGINYQLTKNTEIVFEPNIRYMPNSISEIKNPINQRYLIAGISAAFRQRI